MKVRQRRKPDFRRIGPCRTYSIAELAEAIQRTPSTVRSWIREGMPTLDARKPVVIDGAQAKKWLRSKWEGRKQRTAANEAHCLSCRKSRPFLEGSRSLLRITDKVLAMTGECAVCRCRMNKFASAKSISLFDTQNERKRGRNTA